MNETGKTLECPFTWGLDENLARAFEVDEFVNIDDQPVKAIVYPATLVFAYVIKNDFASACEQMHLAVENLKTIDLQQLKEDKIAANVIVHIVRATKYYYFMARGNSSEAQKALTNAPDLELEQLRDKVNIGTLNGCKGIAWSTFYNAPENFASSYLKRAINNSPDSALWHLMLGRRLRSIRRDNLDSTHPTVEEKNHLLRAFKLSGESDYVGVFVAHMYWEQRNFSESRKLCLKIYNNEPKSVGIRLRLTLCLIRDCDFERAKVCLDFVQNVCSDNTMFLHYKAYYYERQNNYSMAALYYRESAKSGNFKADVKYGETMAKLQETYNLGEHLESMLNKYDKPNYQQNLHLKIAMRYYYDKNLKKSLIHFKKAIEINPKSSQLKDFFNTVDKKKCNIFHFIQAQLVPDCLKAYDKVPEDIKIDYKALKQLIKDNTEKLTNSLKNMKLQ